MRDDDEAQAEATRDPISLSGRSVQMIMDRQCFPGAVQVKCPLGGAALGGCFPSAWPGLACL